MSSDSTYLRTVQGYLLVDLLIVLFMGFQAVQDALPTWLRIICGTEALAFIGLMLWIVRNARKS